MAKNLTKKKQRIAHNKTNEDNEMLSEGNDLLLGIFEDMKKNNDLSAIYLNNFENNFTETTKTFTKLNTQNKPVQIPNPNYTNVLKTKTFGLARKAPLMEKCTKALKQIKHNRQLPKPRAHLAGISISPKHKNSGASLSNLLAKSKVPHLKLSNLPPKSKVPNVRLSNVPDKPKISNVRLPDPPAKPRAQHGTGLPNLKSFNNNLISDLRPKKSNVVAKHTNQSQCKVTTELQHHRLPVYEHNKEKKISEQSRNKTIFSKNCKSDNMKVNSVNKTSNVISSKVDKTADISSESDDDKFESFIQKVCPKNSKTKKENKKKSQKSTKVIKKHISKPVSLKSDSDLSAEETSTSSKPSTYKKSKSEISKRDRGSQSKQARKGHTADAIPKFMSDSDCDFSDKESSRLKRVRKKRSLGAISKSVSENDSDKSDKLFKTCYRRSKRMKRNEVLESKQSISKVDSESEMDIVNDEINHDSSESGDLPPLSEVCNLQYTNCTGPSEQINSVQNPILDFSSLSDKISNHCSIVFNNNLKEDSSYNASVVSNAKNCASSDIPGTNSLTVNEIKPVLHNKIPHTALSVGSNQLNISHKTSVNSSPVSSVQLSVSCKTDTASLVGSDKLSKQNFAVRNDSALNDFSQEKSSNNAEVDLAKSDNDNSFTIMPKIVMITGQIPDPPQSDSEESEIELVDVIVYDLPDKNKTNSTGKKVVSASANASKKSSIKTEKADNTQTCSIAKPQNTQKSDTALQTSLNTNYEVAYMTGICEGIGKQAKSNGNIISQSDINKDKLGSSAVGNAENSPLLSKVKQEPMDDCEIILDIDSASNKNQSLPQVQTCSTKIKNEKGSNIVKEVSSVGIAKNSSVATKQTDQSGTIVSNGESSLILSKNIKEESCENECEIVLDITSATNTNLSVPSPNVRICTTKIKSEKGSNKEVASVAKNSSVTTTAAKQINLSSTIVSNRESSFALNKNIKKEICDDDCEIVFDIDRASHTNLNLPSVQVSKNAEVKVERYSKNVKQVSVDCDGSIAAAPKQRNKLSEKEQKLQEIECSNVTNSNYSRNKNTELLKNETDMETTVIKSLLMELKTEFARYQEILHTEQTVENTFKLLEKCQAEKLMSLQTKVTQLLKRNPNSDDCNSIKNAMNKLLDSSEFSSSPSLKDCSNIPPVYHDISSLPNISSQDLKTIANLVPLSSIPADDIKPNLSELQCALKKEPSASDEIMSMSFGEKCIVCGKEAAAACQQCAKVFFCSNPCGRKYWDNGHKNICGK